MEAQMAWWMGFHVFRQYLESQLDAVLEAATTGRLTSAITWAEDLRKTLGSHPALKGSLSHREIS